MSGGGNGGLVVLHVAEKPSVARSISGILSARAHAGVSTRAGQSRYNPLHCFAAAVPACGGAVAQHVVTSVTGHVMELDFVGAAKSWSAVEPGELFHAPVATAVADDKRALARQLQQEARGAAWLYLWLDCDREGENIASEVVALCTQTNARLRLARPRFSSLVPADILRAFDAPGALDTNAARAVDARRELDLRIGAVFSRFQTMRFRSAVAAAAGAAEADKQVISYGPCQFPTLGFVVRRFWEIESFAPEDFWELRVLAPGVADDSKPQGQQGEEENKEEEGGDSIGETPTKRRRKCAAVGTGTGVGRKKNNDEDTKDTGTGAVVFRWDRGRLYDRAACLALYEDCVEAPTATVVSVRGKQVRKTRPLPMTTVDMQKLGTRMLHMTAERVMAVAERLYQKGFISYPRTETNQFPQGFDFRAHVAQQEGHPRWGAYARTLFAEGSRFLLPRVGAQTDNAHSPIHPTKSAAGDELADADERRLYELVARHFLACCSHDALGRETVVQIAVAGESFRTTGLIVDEPNYLDVYPYDRWRSRACPRYVEGQTFRPTAVLMRQGTTTAPPLLSEPDLITLMDKNGIGTDATIAEHIQKIQDRRYVAKNAAGLFLPTPLGIGLVEAYEAIDLAGLWLPQVRADSEASMAQIAAGRLAKQTAVDTAVASYQALFVSAERRAAEMAAVLRARAARGVVIPPAAASSASARRRSNGDGDGDDDSDDDDDDDDDNSGGGSGSGGQKQGQRGVRKPPTCSKCHQVGHTSRGCPQNRPADGTPPKARRGRAAAATATSTTSSTGSSNGNNCFRCGKPGHFSRDCPEHASRR